MIGSGDLADVGCGDRYFATEADALDEAVPEKLIVVVRGGANKAHHRKQCDADAHARDFAEALCRPAEAECADGLPNEANGQHGANLRRPNFPGAYQNWNNIGNRQRVEGIEEGCDAEQNAHFDVP